MLVEDRPLLAKTHQIAQNIYILPRQGRRLKKSAGLRSSSAGLVKLAQLGGQLICYAGK